MLIQRAAEFLGVKENELSPFESMDPFNHLTLKGYLCRRSDAHYGALVLYWIGGQHDQEACEQIIWATPKLEYPFDRNGTFMFPKVVTGKFYEKLDGTNILAYHYQYRGQDYVSFKTRLTPVLQNGKFGAFHDMLIEYLDGNPWVRDTIAMNPQHNISFELYGARNPVMVKYSVPLAMKVLFGVDRINHAVVPPEQLNVDPQNIPEEFRIKSLEDLPTAYNDYRAVMSERNHHDVETLVIEGMVFYTLTDQGTWRMFKCKPEEIEKVHWATGGIPRSALWTTAINAFESGEASVDDYLALLKEEYTDQQIGKSEIRIKAIFNEAQQHVIFAAEVNQAWKLAADAGFDIMKDKNGTMRFLSGHFPREKMKRVGTVVLKQAGLLK